MTAPTMNDAIPRRSDTVECTACSWQGRPYDTDAGHCPECDGECKSLAEIYSDAETKDAKPGTNPGSTGGATFLLRYVENVLPDYHYQFSDEASLQAAIAAVLTEHNIRFQREVHLGADDRPDFVLDHGVAIEVKVDGSMASAIRQAHRYCARPEITCVVLAASTRWAAMRPALQHGNGKPIVLIHLKRKAF
jgi:hypothetical protein